MDGSGKDLAHWPHKHGQTPLFTRLCRDCPYQNSEGGKKLAKRPRPEDRKSGGFRNAG